jgi:hypothetical protein
MLQHSALSPLDQLLAFADLFLVILLAPGLLLLLVHEALEPLEDKLLHRCHLAKHALHQQFGHLLVPGSIIIFILSETVIALRFWA